MRVIPTTTGDQRVSPDQAFVVGYTKLYIYRKAWDRLHSRSQPLCAGDRAFRLEHDRSGRELGGRRTDTHFQLRAPSRWVCAAGTCICTFLLYANDPFTYFILRTLGDQGSCDLPVSSVLYQIESTYGFTPLTINVGTAYFRRLAASNQAMLQVSASHPTFIGLVRGLTFAEPGKPLVGAIHVPYLSNEVWLTLIHLTCTYIAAKNLANTPSRCSLRAIVSHIYGVDSCTIDPELSSDIEIQCLEALDWRLGAPAVQQEGTSYAADRQLPVSPMACNQEQPGMYDPALSSANKYALTGCICKVVSSSWPSTLLRC